MKTRLADNCYPVIEDGQMVGVCWRLGGDSDKDGSILHRGNGLPAVVYFDGRGVEYWKNGKLKKRGVSMAEIVK